MGLREFFSGFRSKKNVCHSDIDLTKLTSCTVEIPIDLSKKITEHCQNEQITKKEFIIKSLMKEFNYPIDSNFELPEKQEKHIDIYLKMAQSGFINAKIADSIFNSRGRSVYYARKRKLKHVRVGRFFFFKQVDVESLAKKLSKKK
jgi:hypothetical protein